MPWKPGGVAYSSKLHGILNQCGFSRLNLGGWRGQLFSSRLGSRRHDCGQTSYGDGGCCPLCHAVSPRQAPTPVEKTWAPS